MLPSFGHVLFSSLEISDILGAIFAAQTAARAVVKTPTERSAQKTVGG